MMNFFEIKPGVPRPGEIAGGAADDLSDAVQTAFPLETDDAIVLWNGVAIPLSYKYDVSIILEDVIGMLESCRIGAARTIYVNFGSDTFNADWTVQLREDSVAVTAVWNSVVGDREAELNKCSTLVINRDDFTSQWLGVLCRAIEGVKAARIRIRDESLLVRAERLCRA